jgi:hypothetical protein
MFLLISDQCLTPFKSCREHKNFLARGKRKSKRDIENAHHSTFVDWFSNHVSSAAKIFFGE